MSALLDIAGVTGEIWAGPGVSVSTICGKLRVDEEWLYSGSLGSISPLSLDGRLLFSLSGCCEWFSCEWPYRIGACRLRVFFLIPPAPPGRLAVVALVRRVEPLLRGIVLRAG